LKLSNRIFACCCFTFPCTGRGAIKSAPGGWLKFRRPFLRQDRSKACRPACREELELAQSARRSE
jgi:hypothetical protein